MPWHALGLVSSRSRELPTWITNFDKSKLTGKMQTKHKSWTNFKCDDKENIIKNMILFSTLECEQNCSFAKKISCLLRTQCAMFLLQEFYALVIFIAPVQFIWILDDKVYVSIPNQSCLHRFNFSEMSTPWPNIAALWGICKQAAGGTFSQPIHY